MGSLNPGHSIQKGRTRLKREEVSFLLISAAGSKADSSGGSPAWGGATAVARIGHGSCSSEVGENGTSMGLS
jgi:hypothetical protein